MNQELFQRIKNYILTFHIEKKEYSDDFAGVYLISNSVFQLNDHKASLNSFRLYTKYQYPLYFFISRDAYSADFDKFYNQYPNIIVKEIPRLNDIYEFNDFSINNLLYYIDDRHEKLLYFQNDSMFIKEGIEDLCEGYSWLGPAWAEPIRVIEDTFNFGWQQVGNGGINYRRKSKCLEVLDLVNKFGGQKSIVKGLQIKDKHRTYGPFLAEDALYCHFGFGVGIFEPVSIEHANKFGLEPITFKQFINKESCALHRIDNYE